MTPGQRWRFRRDLVIHLSHHSLGLSQRLLADVFDLPRSRVWKICQAPPRPPRARGK